MSKAEEYQFSYDECFKIYNARPEDTINSLRFLVEEMIETIRYLEEFASKESQNKRLKLETSIRTGVKIND